MSLGSRSKMPQFTSRAIKLVNLDYELHLQALTVYGAGHILPVSLEKEWLVSAQFLPFLSLTTSSYKYDAVELFLEVTFTVYLCSTVPICSCRKQATYVQGKCFCYFSLVIFHWAGTKAGDSKLDDLHQKNLSHRCSSWWFEDLSFSTVVILFPGNLQTWCFCLNRLGNGWYHMGISREGRKCFVGFVSLTLLGEAALRGGRDNNPQSATSMAPWSQLMSRTKLTASPYIRWLRSFWCTIGKKRRPCGLPWPFQRWLCS